MVPEIYKIKYDGDGFLAIMAKPRKGDWLEDEIKGLAALDVNVIVSLLDFGEILELGLRQEQAICEANSIEFLSFPIKDRGVPDSPAHFVHFVRHLHQKLLDGQNMVIHCRAGIGRSGLMAACLLVHANESPHKAFARVSEARKLNVPDTREQIDWVSNIYPFYANKIDQETSLDRHGPLKAELNQRFWAGC